MEVKFYDHSDDNFNKIPKEVFDMLNIITVDNFKEMISKKNNETQEIKEPHTKSNLLNEIEREKQLLMEEMLDLDNEETINEEKHVTFVEFRTIPET